MPYKPYKRLEEWFKQIDNIIESDKSLTLINTRFLMDKLHVSKSRAYQLLKAYAYSRGYKFEKGKVIVRKMRFYIFLEDIIKPKKEEAKGIQSGGYQNA